MYNHIFLLHRYMHELKELTLAQSLLEKGRNIHANDPEVQYGLDRLQVELNNKRDKIYDDMFEIPRSN